jgi:hypothetical protein
VPSDLAPFVDHFKEFLDLAQPEYHYLEETVWSDTHRYAGSFDAFATINGERVWIDNKTTRSGIHEEVGVQLAAYRFADNIIRSDGARIPMPKADGGAVLHIRPEGWQLVPVRADYALFEEVFLPLRKVFDYEQTTKKTIVGQPVYSGPSTSTLKAPVKRRAPRVAKPATETTK